MTDLILAAGETKIIENAKGAVFFYPIACSHSFFTIDYGEGATISGRSLGFESRDELGNAKPFVQISITNTNTEEMRLSFIMGNSKPFDARANGGGYVTSTGTIINDVAVTGKMLTIEGGSVQVIGNKNKRKTVDSRNTGAEYKELITELENKNGVIITYADVLITDVNGSADFDQFLELGLVAVNGAQKIRLLNLTRIGNLDGAKGVFIPKNWSIGLQSYRTRGTLMINYEIL